jgi:aspartate ammonia-lyase
MISGIWPIKGIIVGREKSKSHIYCVFGEFIGSLKKKVHMLNNIRIEEDLLGTREVPADAYYGVHTLRAIENFYISNSKISDIPEFVAAW